MNIRILSNERRYISAFKRHVSVCSVNHCLSGDTNKWDPKLHVVDTAMKHSIEAKWRDHIGKYGYTEGASSPKSYILSMFPYPSGALHMGHVRVYAISDSIARFYRMKGYNVLHPMGWDAFGLPAENAAIERGIEPAEWTQKNIAQMRSQLKQLGFSFDWDRELSTCSPEYYRWTQHIFLRMYKAGLVYHKSALVNWDPVDKTVLADEQVDSNGMSWRSGAKVEKKLLKQWFIRATQLAKSLYQELGSPELKNWRDIIQLQKEWIGEPDGTTFDWKVEGGTESVVLPVWTSRAENTLESTFIAVAPGSMLDIMQPHCASERSYTIETSENETVSFKVKRLDFTASNPFTDEMLPVVVVDGLFPFENGFEHHMGVPSASKTDHSFCEIVGLPLRPQKNTKLLLGENLHESLCSEAQRRGIGGYATSARLRDWLISRQRYWGTPIPIVHCKSCGTVPVPDSQLPVQLPKFPHGSYTGSSRLTQAVDWLHTSCPKCGGQATRETDTMDTFVDSSWYFLRYIDPQNGESLCDTEKAKHLFPVDVYVGGKEHAVLHLYFARLVCHFLYQEGLLPQPEPFKRLLVQGMVLGRSFRDKNTGQYLKPEDVVPGKLETLSGQPVLVEWEKMSKSKHNGVDPADMLRDYGVDTTRLLILADVAPESNRKWSSDTFTGVLRWQARMYSMVSLFRFHREKAARGILDCDRMSEKFIAGDQECFSARNSHLRSISFCYSTSHQLSVAVTSMQGLCTKLKKMSEEIIAFSPEYERALATLIIVLAPMAPHFASELWEGFVSAGGHFNKNSSEILWDRPVLEQTWPEVDPHFGLPLTIQVNNCEVCTVSVPRTQMDVMSKEEAQNIALQHSVVHGLLQGQLPHRVLFSVTPAYKGIVSLFVPGVSVGIEQINARSSKAKKALSKMKRKLEKSDQ